MNDSAWVFLGVGLLTLTLLNIRLSSRLARLERSAARRVKARVSPPAPEPTPGPPASTSASPSPADPQDTAPRSESTDEHPTDGDESTPPVPTDPAKLPTTLQEALDALPGVYGPARHPVEFLNHPLFVRCVELMDASGATTAQLLSTYTGPTVPPACVALEVLARRKDNDPVLVPILSKITSVAPWTAFFAMRTLLQRVREPLVAQAFRFLDDDWTTMPQLDLLRTMLEARQNPVEVAAFVAMLPTVTREARAQIKKLLTTAQSPAGTVYLTALQQFEASYFDPAAVAAIGRTWNAKSESADTIELPQFEQHVQSITSQLEDTVPRGVLLVGANGVGKTSIARLYARAAEARGYTVFAASAADVLAGQVYIGQLEERINALVHELTGKRVVWFVPNFDDMFWAGQHRYSPRGILDLVLPHIESGAIRVLGEIRTSAYEHLEQLVPKLADVMHVHRVDPLDDAATMELGRRWAAKHTTPPAAPILTDATLREALQLAKQYLSERAEPGMLMYLLEATERRRSDDDVASARPIQSPDVLAALSQMTGLPVSILDDAQPLDLVALRSYFERNVLGQPEAVGCLIERVAMIKAGLTDPTRPLGVFLFVGPTGTGKTQIAKTLAEYLFGSPDRMIRLDMSELQTSESVSRLVGGSDDRALGRALVDMIRLQPFSVVLLDEFEKAHPAVHDLFLQLFDDGRLTDRQGSTADFRHCIVIMTSNLGATVAKGSSIGFSGQAGAFAPTAVQRAVDEAFRREFINRIDRIVVFHPLSLAVMRDLLQKELRDVLQRRGLRNRQWAVEWDASAIDFLLERGFSPDLGARPLKRAVEQYVLTPLARTIVSHEVPAGDQFLFVRSDGTGIQVEFVDPDAPDEEVSDTLQAMPEADAERQVESLVISAAGTSEELALLQAEHRRLMSLIESPEWAERKAHALDAMRTDGFWSSPGRFAVLGLAEYMDRVESGLDTASSLLRRLSDRRSPHQRVPRDLVQRLAQQLYLLRSACDGLAQSLPRDAFVEVRSLRDGAADGAAPDKFAERLGEMYRAWGEKRRMHVRVLSERRPSPTHPYAITLAVSGYAAYPLLRDEDGLHVLETPTDDHSFVRAQALVRVVPQPDEPIGGSTTLADQAADAFVTDTPATPAVVRRYRELPSPLVRDRVSDWRTGRLDLVLGGDFDVIGARDAEAANA